MMNNAYLNINFTDLIDMLDARKNINLFEEKDDESNLVFSGKVFNLLSDFESLGLEFYKVTGLQIALGTISVLIRKERLKI